jgi:hypothetical protein
MKYTFKIANYVLALPFRENPTHSSSWAWNHSSFHSKEQGRAAMATAGTGTARISDTTNQTSAKMAPPNTTPYNSHSSFKTTTTTSLYRPMLPTATPDSLGRSKISRQQLLRTISRGKWSQSRTDWPIP